MRIAFVLSAVSNHGPFLVARNIINNIHSKVDPIDIFYLKESDEQLSFKGSCIKINFFTKIDFSKYDVIHSHGFIADMFMFLNRKAFNGNWITTMHQNIKPDYGLNYNIIIGLVLERVWCYAVNRSNCCVALTNDMVGYYKKKITKPYLTYIYNGISTEQAVTPIAQSDLALIRVLKSKYHILGVSANLIFRKGIDQIIRALALDTSEKSALIVLGSGPEKENLQKLAIEEKVENRCLFLGRKDNALSYYKYFDLYVMASRSEAFGLCVIEAASQKIPVICSDLDVYRELFTDEEVVRFDLNDLETLAAAFDIAADNSEKLSGNIYARYRSSFTAEIMAQNYLSTYHKLVNGLISDKII